MGIMAKMMGIMMERMSKEEKDDMMGKMMEEFFADMTVEDKHKMMEGGKEGEMPMMPQMMMGMMPQCLKIMLPNMPKEKRIDFVLEIVTTLMEHSCADISDEEKEDLVAKMIEKVNV